MAYLKREQFFSNKNKKIWKIKENQIILKPVESFTEETIDHPDLPYIQSLYYHFQSGNVETLLGFADSLNEVKLNLYGIDILFSLLAQWVVEKKLTKDSLLESDVHQVMSRIASIALHQFNNHFENESFMLQKSSNKLIASFIYNLGLIETVHLATPTPSNSVLNTIGFLLSDFEKNPADAKVISDFLLGLGLISQQQSYSVAINHLIISKQLTALTEMASEEISSFEIAKSIHGLSLIITKASCMFNFTLDINNLRKLLLIQCKEFINRPKENRDDRSILITINALKMMVNSNHLNGQQTNQIISEALEKLKRNEIQLKFHAGVNSARSPYGLHCLFSSGMAPYTESNQLKKEQASLSFSR